MEEVGAQVAPLPPYHHHHHPMYIHNNRKRDYPYHRNSTTNYFQPQDFENKSWNAKAWEWDSSRFVAKPVQQQEKEQEQEQEQHRLLNLNLGSNATNTNSNSNNGLNYSAVVDESGVPRSTKRVRSGSPSSYGVPVCQVDDCKQDLSNAKDYHRRHKVCLLHSKSSQALLSNTLQRFCQQCSRFHPLSEFDEGKRSCRRRLAGHNRRRRKTTTQSEDVTSSRMTHTPNINDASNGNLDIVNLLAAFARAQGRIENTNFNCTSEANKDQLIQILSKINSLPFPMDLVAKLPKLENLNGKVTENPLDLGNKLNLDMSSPSTMDLLAVLSATLASSAPNNLATLSCHSSHSTESEKTSLTHIEGAPDISLQNRSPQEFPSGARSCTTSYQSHNDDSDCQVQETRGNLQLQLFNSSPENDSLPKLDPSRKYFSSGSSNPVEERSPSYSPPIMQNLFPLESSSGAIKSRSSESSADAVNSGNMLLGGKLKENIQASGMPLELFTGSNLGPDYGSNQINSCQAGYYSSGSDHSPSSWNSDMKDRTGKITFKLFDKDPSHFPATVREQICKWLSNSPSDMESYIRPGCVVLSIYASMSIAVWAQLEENLLQYVKSLVQDSGCDFWGSGRFLVQTGRQLASHREGNIRICKSWKTWSSPVLISVSPLAVISGRETSFLLRGRNLTSPGTKIHFTCMGGYASQEVASSSNSRSHSDEITIKGVKIQEGPSSVLGRCYVEVENGFKGNSFPIIIADAAICDELRLLESVFDGEVKEYDINSQERVGSVSSREEVLHFLNEIGWLFQRKWNLSIYNCPDYSVYRFKFLIIFSVERDYCALVKTILDMMVQSQFDGNKLSDESMEMLSEVQLLNRAVKRRCRKMLDLLIHYYIIGSDGTSKIFLFPPNIAGQGGITPLHLAACTSCSDDLIDALTNDPQQIGLNCWNSLLDATGQSPYNYATMRNNLSCNSLVARKLADGRNGQVSVMVRNETELQHMQTLQHGLMLKTCAKCASVSSKYRSRYSASRSWLHRPYITSILAIAAVCVCVCLFFRGSPDIGMIEPFKWENLDYGTH